jgi:hypothetical protein
MSHESSPTQHAAGVNVVAAMTIGGIAICLLAIRRSLLRRAFGRASRKRKSRAYIRSQSQRAIANP